MKTPSPGVAALIGQVAPGVVRPFAHLIPIVAPTRAEPSKPVPEKPAKRPDVDDDDDKQDDERDERDLRRAIRAGYRPAIMAAERVALRRVARILRHAGAERNF